MTDFNAIDAQDELQSILCDIQGAATLLTLTASSDFVDDSLENALLAVVRTLDAAASKTVNLQEHLA